MWSSFSEQRVADTNCLAAAMIRFTHRGANGGFAADGFSSPRNTPSLPQRGWVTDAKEGTFSGFVGVGADCRHLRNAVTRSILDATSKSLQVGDEVAALVGGEGARSRDPLGGMGALKERVERFGAAIVQKS